MKARNSRWNNKVPISRYNQATKTQDQAISNINEMYNGNHIFPSCGKMRATQMEKLRNSWKTQKLSYNIGNISIKKKKIKKHS